MKTKILEILGYAFDPEIAEMKAEEIIELFNGHKCPECGEELRFGLSKEIKDIFKNSKLFKRN